MGETCVSVPQYPGECVTTVDTDPASVDQHNEEVLRRFSGDTSSYESATQAEQDAEKAEAERLIQLYNGTGFGLTDR